MPTNVNQMLSLSIWQSLLERVIIFLPQLITSIVILLVFWLVGIGVQRLVERLWKAGKLESDLGALLGLIAKLALVAVGAMTALGTIGVDITALVAGLGLTGFALGFALKDIISNAIAGILVIIFEPFKRNDSIVVTGFEGTVVEINLRYTVLETEDKKTFVPNSNLFTNPVVVKKPKPNLPPEDLVVVSEEQPAGPKGSPLK